MCPSVKALGHMCGDKVCMSGIIYVYVIQLSRVVQVNVNELNLYQERQLYNTLIPTSHESPAVGLRISHLSDPLS